MDISQFNKNIKLYKFLVGNNIKKYLIYLNI